MNLFHQREQVCLRSRSFLVLNWKQNVEIANVIQSIEESLAMFRSQRHNKISRQIPEKECFSLSALCASHHPDAVYVSHLETRT